MKKQKRSPITTIEEAEKVIYRICDRIEDLHNTDIHYGLCLEDIQESLERKKRPRISTHDVYQFILVSFLVAVSIKYIFS